MREITTGATTRAPQTPAAAAFLSGLVQRFLRWCQPELRTPQWWGEWLVVTTISVVFVSVVFLAIITTRCWGWGLVRISANSLADVFPKGSCVLSLPLTPKDGDFVIAYGRLDKPETMKDLPERIMVKQFKSGKLVSTYNGETASEFRITGRVVAYLPTQKVFWWWDTGAQKPAPNFAPQPPETIKVYSTMEKNQALNNQEREAWVKQNCSRVYFNLPSRTAEWRFQPKQPINMVRVQANTPYAVCLYDEGRIKIGETVAPKGMTTLYVSRQGFKAKWIEVKLEQADPLPGSAGLDTIELWLKI